LRPKRINVDTWWCSRRDH